MVTGEHLDPKEAKKKKIFKLGGACEGWICGWIPVSGLRFSVHPRVWAEVPRLQDWALSPLS